MMSTGEFRVPIPVLRDAVRRAVEATSYRQVAGELRLSTNSVFKFVTGETLPKEKTLNRMRDWYVQHAAELGPSPAAVDAAFAVLLDGLPGALQARGALQCANVIKALHGEYGDAAPPWIPRILARPIPAGPPGREGRT